jgi:hypothetical protein
MSDPINALPGPAAGWVTNNADGVLDFGSVPEQKPSKPNASQAKLNKNYLFLRTCQSPSSITPVYRFYLCNTNDTLPTTVDATFTSEELEADYASGMSRVDGIVYGG